MGLIIAGLLIISCTGVVIAYHSGWEKGLWEGARIRNIRK